LFLSRLRWLADWSAFLDCVGSRGGD